MSGPTPAQIQSPAEIAEAVLDAHYGVGTPYEHPSLYDEAGLTLALADGDVDAADVCAHIVEGVETYRDELRAAFADDAEHALDSADPAAAAAVLARLIATLHGA